MKITLEMNNITFTWEEKHDDLTSDEMLDVFGKLMYSAGYQLESIRRSIIELAEEYQSEFE